MVKQKGYSIGYKQGILDFIGHSNYPQFKLHKSAAIRLKKFGRIKVKKSRIWG